MGYRTGISESQGQSGKSPDSVWGVFLECFLETFGSPGAGGQAFVCAKKKGLRQKTRSGKPLSILSGFPFFPHLLPFFSPLDSTGFLTRFPVFFHDLFPVFPQIGAKTDEKFTRFFILICEFITLFCEYFPQKI